MTRATISSVRMALAAVSLVAGRTSAHAQALLPEKGEATVAVSFQQILVTQHALPVERMDVGRVSTSTLIVDVGYTLTRRLAIDFGLPYVASSYSGPYPHDPVAFGYTGQRTLDDGRSHGTFQDLRVGARYNLVAGRLSVTPFIGTITPSHDYTFYAHSAVGRRLRELAFGTYASTVLDGLLPGLFVQGRYSYSLTQRVLDIRHNHSNMDLEVGYFVSPDFRVFMMSAAQVTHGGVDLTFDAFRPSPDVNRNTFEDLDLHHDRIDRGNYLNLGGGAAFSMTESMDIFGSFVRTVAARNGHLVDRGVTIGLAWTLPRFGRPAPRAAKLDQARRSLVRCVCQKQK